MITTTRRKQAILVVDDSPEDCTSIIRAFRKAGVTKPIVLCENGYEALDYLFRRGIYADRERFPCPGVILLDLSMPGTDGLQVLDEIKVDDELKVIPVIILTTSAAELDVQECYQAGANSYVKKPMDTDSFMNTIQKLVDYWFAVTILPKCEECAE